MSKNPEAPINYDRQVIEEWLKTNIKPFLESIREEAIKQALLAHARGNTEEAIKILEELPINLEKIKPIAIKAMQEAFLRKQNEKLIKQALLAHARGNTEEAIKILEALITPKKL